MSTLFLFYRFTLLPLAVDDNEYYRVLFCFLSTGPHVSLFWQADSSVFDRTIIPFHRFSGNGTVTRPHERGDGRPHRGVAGPARSEPETRRVVVFPAHTCEPNLERVTSKGKKNTPPPHTLWLMC